MLNMKLPNQLETNNLIIRPYKTSDLSDFIKFMSCTEVTKYLDFPPEQTTVEGARELLEKTLKSYETSEPLFALVIAQKKDNFFIGSCGFSPLDENNSCECFYALLPRYRRQGFATEAMNKLFDYGFQELGIKRINAHINRHNIASIKLAGKLGMNFKSFVDFKGTPKQGKLYYIVEIISNYSEL